MNLKAGDVLRIYNSYYLTGDPYYEITTENQDHFLQKKSFQFVSGYASIHFIPNVNNPPSSSSSNGFVITYQAENYNTLEAVILTILPIVLVFIFIGICVIRCVLKGVQRDEEGEWEGGDLEMMEGGEEERFLTIYDKVVPFIVTPRGLTFDQISILLTYPIQDMSAVDSTCVICMVNYDPEDLVTFLPCKHIFHTECIFTWFKDHRTCPLCKQNVGELLLSEGYDFLCEDNHQIEDNQIEDDEGEEEYYEECEEFQFHFNSNSIYEPVVQNDFGDSEEEQKLSLEEERFPHNIELVSIQPPSLQTSSSSSSFTIDPESHLISIVQEIEQSTSNSLKDTL